MALPPPYAPLPALECAVSHSQDFSVKNRVKVLQLPAKEKKIFFKYFLGDLPKDEFTAAAQWEYARVSVPILYWAALLKKSYRESESVPKLPEEWRLPFALRHVISESRGLDCVPSGHANREGKDECSLSLEDMLSAGKRREIPPRLLSQNWLSIWTNESFPDKRWLELSYEERRHISRHFDSHSGKEDAAQVADVRTLMGSGVIDGWVKAVINAPALSLRGEFPARWIAAPLEHIVLTIDYSTSKEAVGKAFRRWLDGQEGYFKKHYIRKSGRDMPNRKFPQALRDLALGQLHKRARTLEEVSLYVVEERPEAIGWSGRSRAGKAPSVAEIHKAVKRFFEFKRKFDKQFLMSRGLKKRLLKM